ncbi:hypothetical protein JHW43_000490 [Diplocarpon mali]|nr:hypothetical protein JHW43_000490 [Diplocarpon mali]
MAAKRVLVVFGATGLQGGSVVKAVLGDAKPSAKSLESLGVETVAADLNNVSSLKTALQGAYAADEVVIEDAGVQHLIWRILMNVTQLSKGVLTQVLHSDSKAHIERYIRDTGLPATYFMPGFHMSNVPGSNFRRAPPNHDWAFALPVPSSAPIPLLSTADDVGKFVMGILLNREKVLGKQIYGATDYQTPDQIAQPFKEQFPEAGKTAKSVELLHQVFKEIQGSKGMPA